MLFFLAFWWIFKSPSDLKFSLKYMSCGVLFTYVLLGHAGQVKLGCFCAAGWECSAEEGCATCWWKVFINIVVVMCFDFSDVYCRPSQWKQLLFEGVHHYWIYIRP